MKFAIKLILSLITIGMVLSTNTMRSRAKDSGSGDWDEGYNCPKIFISEEGSDAVDQGAAKIRAKTVVEPSTTATKLGLNLEFTTAPAADSIIAKIGNKISAKVYQIPYRFMSADMVFNNPVRDNKTLIGTFIADNRKKYNLRILLPYATIGWYINDEQSNKIRVQINTRGVAAKGNVSLNKSVIATHAENYFTKKALLNSASKDKAALDAEIKKLQKDSTSIDANLATLKTKIEEAKKNLFAKQNNLQTTVNALGHANSLVTTTSIQMNNIDKAVSGLSKPTADQLTKIKKDLEDITNLTDAAYTILKKEVASKAADFDNSKSGLVAMDQTKFDAGLATSYPL